MEPEVEEECSAGGTCVEDGIESSVAGAERSTRRGMDGTCRLCIHTGLSSWASKKQDCLCPGVGEGNLQRRNRKLNRWKDKL